MMMMMRSRGVFCLFASRHGGGCEGSSDDASVGGGDGDPGGSDRDATLEEREVLASLEKMYRRKGTVSRCLKFWLLCVGSVGAVIRPPCTPRPGGLVLVLLFFNSVERRRANCCCRSSGLEDPRLELVSNTTLLTSNLNVWTMRLTPAMQQP
jgi:hypothetical protein